MNVIWLRALADRTESNLDDQTMLRMIADDVEEMLSEIESGCRE